MNVFVVIAMLLKYTIGEVIMRKLVEIKEQKYEYEIQCKDHESLRRSFNKLAQKTFGIDFEQWYKDGYWGNGYITYSLIKDSNIIANVSVSIMEFLIYGEKKRYIQLGTVMTTKEYRGRGLSRFLIEEVIKEWENKCDLMYLFANGSVLDFYPKFGFTISKEYEYSRQLCENQMRTKVEKINLSRSDHRDKFFNIVSKAKAISKITALNNLSLVMFYCTYIMRENIYYIEQYNCIVIANYENNTLYLHDVFTIKEDNLNSIIEAMNIEDVNRVVLGFVPNNIEEYEEKELHEEDTILFIRSGKENPFQVCRLRFPELSHT